MERGVPDSDGPGSKDGAGSKDQAGSKDESTNGQARVEQIDRRVNILDTAM